MTSPDKTLRDSDTPRTSAAKYDTGLRLTSVAQCDQEPDYVVAAHVCEEIERELNAANAEIADLKAKLATARDELNNQIDAAKKECEGTRDPRPPLIPLFPGSIQTPTLYGLVSGMRAERDRYLELLVRMHDDTILDKQDAEYYKRIIKVHREWITEAISPIPKLRQSLPHEWHSGCAYATPKKL